MSTNKLNYSNYNTACREIFEQAFMNACLYDEGVEASRNACVAGASISAAVITCASWNDNPFTGVSALIKLMNCLHQLKNISMNELKTLLENECTEEELVKYNIAKKIKYGFQYVTKEQSIEIKKVCTSLINHSHSRLKWCEYYLENEARIQKEIGLLNLTGLLAMYFHDTGVATNLAEREFMLLKLNASMVEAQKAQLNGVSQFPFFESDYVYEGITPKIKKKNKKQLSQLMKEVGLEEFI